MKPVLEVHQLSKKFTIDSANAPYLTFRERVMGLLGPKGKREEVWALRDVSFEAFEGDAISIIGRNGSGKSTLLKILSKISPPTSGRAIIRGNLASLLEVGTGFHPELTGLENIYLNGSIIGMKRREIKSKIDDIVAFAEIERFLNTPLKRYSSGMQLKLAFAVSVFLNPSILIIDEVLAVGDLEFQKKCTQKMEEISSSGRTILFVSHNLRSVERLCSKAILLENGVVKSSGPTQEVIAKYLYANPSLSLNSVGEYIFNESEKTAAISKVDFLCDGRLADRFYTSCNLQIRVHFRALEKPLRYPVVKLTLYDQQDAAVLGLSNKNYMGNLASDAVTEGALLITFDTLPLIPGLYRVDLQLSDDATVLDTQSNFTQLNVERNEEPTMLEPISSRFNSLYLKDISWALEAKR